MHMQSYIEAADICLHFAHAALGVGKKRQMQSYIEAADTCLHFVHDALGVRKKRQMPASIAQAQVRGRRRGIPIDTYKHIYK